MNQIGLTSHMGPTLTQSVNRGDSLLWLARSGSCAFPVGRSRVRHTNYIGWAGLLWNRREKFPQRMRCWTRIFLWVMFWADHFRLTRASWEHHLSPDHHPANITRHLPQIKLHADIVLYECTFSGNQPPHHLFQNINWYATLSKEVLH